jgi:hypothetical protein
VDHRFGENCQRINEGRQRKSATKEVESVPVLIAPRRQCSGYLLNIRIQDAGGKKVYCIKCGKEIEAGGSFCQFCGTKQSEPPPVYQSNDVLPPMTQPNAVPPPVYQPNITPSPVVYPSQSYAQHSYPPQAGSMYYNPHVNPAYNDPFTQNPVTQTKNIKIFSLTIFAGVILTLILSLFFVFAWNEDLPLMKSTGLGLLGVGEQIVNENERSHITYRGREDFFNNIYGFTHRDASGAIVPDNSAVVIGMVVKVIYWIFCLLCVGTMCVVLISVFSKSGIIKAALILALIEVFLGLAVVIIALICVTYASAMFSMYTYTTQYYFLIIPLALTFVFVLLAKKDLKKIRM